MNVLSFVSVGMPVVWWETSGRWALVVGGKANA